MKYIISGDKGLIGTFLKKELNKEHECVMNIDLKDGYDVNRLPSYKQRTADVFIHLAAHCKINESVSDPTRTHKKNVNGIHKVLEYCRENNIPKILAMSSSRVLSPQKNPYTASKMYVEELTKAYAACYGIEYIIIRPSTVYGPMNDVTPRLIHDWCQAAIKDEELPIYGDENKTLDFTHVDDFVNGTMMLIENWDLCKNETYDISGKEEMNLTKLGNMIIREASGGHLKFYPPETEQPQHVNIDISKMELIGYSPKIKLEEGVKQMVAFYKNG